MYVNIFSDMEHWLQTGTIAYYIEAGENRKRETNCSAVIGTSIFCEISFTIYICINKFQIAQVLFYCQFAITTTLSLHWDLKKKKL